MSDSYTLIENVRIPESGSSFHGTKSILIKDPGSHGESVIEEIGDITPTERMRRYNGDGMYALPAFHDMFCFLSEPDTSAARSVLFTTLSAISGGYSSVLAMPDMNFGADGGKSFSEYKSFFDKNALCDVRLACPIMTGTGRESISDFCLFSNSGGVFTDINSRIGDVALLQETMHICADKDLLFITKCDDSGLSGGGAVNLGKVSRLLKVAGIPESAENFATARILLLAKETGCRVHISQVSTAGAVTMIREAKANGVNVTCDTSPQYFSFCDTDVIYYGTYAKVSPPLRSAESRLAIIEGLKDGTIDCISSAHTPVSDAEKHRPMALSGFGMVGVQTAFPAAMTYLVYEHGMSLYRLCELMSVNPARILCMKDCGLRRGCSADIVIADLSREIIVTKSMLKSKSNNTPFLGLTLRGLPVEIFLGGKPRFNTLK